MRMGAGAGIERMNHTAKGHRLRAEVVASALVAVYPQSRLTTANSKTSIMRTRNLSRNWEPPSCAPTSASPGNPRRPHLVSRHWLAVLKEDKRAIFSAAAHAQRAADFLNSLQPQQHEERAAA